MRKVNYFKLMGVAAMLSPMSFSPNALAQSVDFDEAHLKSHVMVQDNTYVDLSHIKPVETIDKGSKGSESEVIEKVTDTESISEEPIIIITEAPKKPELILTDIEPFPGAVEVKGLDQSQSVFQIQEDLNRLLATDDIGQEIEVAEVLPEVEVDATEVQAEEELTTSSIVQTQTDETTEVETADVGTDIAVETEVDQVTEKTNLEQVVCEQKNQIAELTKTIEELKTSAQAPFDSTYQMMSQLMMMNQMMMMQNQSGGYYQRAGSNYEIMNSYMEPMRIMSSMMLTNQQLMLNNMSALTSVSPLAANGLSAGTTYNVGGDFYSGDYSMTSPQNYQLPMPQAMSADYRSFGNIVQSPRSVEPTPATATQSTPANVSTQIDVPNTDLNDISESV